ncbi:tetratricopeptide repeat protein [Hymenobacter sp. BT186]|uniref:histidine kinase n=1 Tax=Hymenobacter telluris TaxID=2816474 RepID=A0A939ESD2_9BACT|nr:tetratricopeptide repeat protein [Hymenobacter telluris]MBO0356583.1 tetratricopeptide repeat protein [Hymenobacter telluris]MBW3372608.1 tetratricopeptide repeat protein [Hymenobacter norwichensis]
MKPWLLLLLLLLSSAAWANSPAVDRLQAQVQAHPQADTARVNLLNALAFEQRSTVPRASRASFEEALALARQLNYSLGTAKALLGLGFYYRKRNEYSPAQLHTEQARVLFERLPDQRNLLACTYNLAYIYFGQGNYTQALDYSQQGLQLAEKLNDPHWLVLMNAQLGIISTEVGEYSKARLYLEQCLRLARQHHNQSGVSQGLRGLGDLYRTQEKWTIARRYYEQDMLLARRLGDKPGASVEEMNVADMAEHQGHYREVFTYCYQVLRQLRQLDVVGYLPWTHLVLARAHLHTNRPDSALYYGKASLQASLRSGTKENIRDVSEVLTQASATTGNMAAAYRYQRLFTIYQDSLSSRDLIRRIAALQYGYELDRKQARIKQLTRTQQLIQQKNRQQQWLLLVSLAGLLLVGALSVILWRSNTQKQRAYALLEKQQTELLATQKQLVAAEKWAFVGEVSAGIAHELQNPLHFMKKFAEVSVALLDHDSHTAPPSDTASAELQQEIVAGLKQNLQEISQHGQRASSIIADMLAHARTGSAQRESIYINVLVEENLQLAQQIALSKEPPFQATVHTTFDAAAGQVTVVPAEIGRGLLNLFTNALHALETRYSQAEANYQPVLRVSTERINGQVAIRIHDNGTGMAEETKQQIFQPFFTTKPLGKGTGLGLSLAHDTITKGHGGTIQVETKAGKFTEFTILLPA